MRNLRIKTKLIINSMVLCTLAVIVGIVGIVGLHSVNKADNSLYDYNVISMDLLGSIRENFACQRAAYRNFLIYETDSQSFSASIDTLSGLEASMEEYINAYLPLLKEQSELDLFNSFLALYNTDFKNMKEDMLVYCAENRADEFLPVLSSMGQVTTNLSNILNDCYRNNVLFAKSAVEENNALYAKLVTAVVSLLVVSVLVGIFLTVYISSLLSTPLYYMAHALTQIGTKGELTLDAETAESASKEVARKDEIGSCARAAVCLIEYMTNISKILERIAVGDLSFEINKLSEHDVIGASLAGVLENLNGMFGEINNSALQVAGGTRQIADGSQTLAQGTAQQASAVEQLSCSISEIAAQTEENVSMANNASKLAQTIKTDAEKGNGQMDQMLDAVKNILDASQNISKVIKVIDDIAFQTNILALNAAVEAARAGSHGKGFAVVAEEVRSLAAKSSAAAKDTGELIANSMQKAELGAHIAGETAESLSSIVVGINENRRIVSDITQSFEKQAAAIAQINKGIEQVAHVIQQNSATAQESAAASEEMSQQSDMLKGMVGRFKIKADKNSIIM